MKRQVLRAVVLLFTCGVLARVASAQAYTWTPLTPHDAIEVVRALEGAPELTVTVTELPRSRWPDTTDHYKLVAGRYNYSVCAWTPDLFIRNDTYFYDLRKRKQFYGLPLDEKPFEPDDALKQRVMPQEAARRIALDFMRARYPEPQLLTKEIVTADPHISDNTFTESYIFMFYQDCGNGVAGPSFCNVTVDSVQGEVVKYASSHFPVLVSTVPRVTGRQAMTAAINALRISQGRFGNLEAAQVSKPDALGLQQLLYKVTFEGIGPPERKWPTKYSAVVDAHTGTIMDWDIRMGATAPSGITGPAVTPNHFPQRQPQPLPLVWAGRDVKLAYSPLLVGNKPYIYVGYLCYGMPNAKTVYTNRKHIAVAGDGRQAIFSLDARTYQLNGRTRVMTSKPVLVNGRCYVPLEVVKAVLPFQVNYDPNPRQVRFGPLR